MPGGAPDSLDAFLGPEKRLRNSRSTPVLRTYKSRTNQKFKTRADGRGSRNSAKKTKRLTIEEVHLQANIRQRQARTLVETDLEEIKQVFQHLGLKRAKISTPVKREKIQTHAGTLKFRLAIRSMPPTDQFSQPDSMIKIKMMEGKDVRDFRTESQINQLNPVFTKYTFDCNFDEARDPHRIELAVVDCDDRGRPTTQLGRVSVTAEQLAQLCEKYLMDRKTAEKRGLLNSTSVHSKLRDSVGAALNEAVLSFPVAGVNSEENRQFQEKGTAVLIITRFVALPAKLITETWMKQRQGNRKRRGVGRRRTRAPRAAGKSGKSGKSAKKKYR